MGVWELTIILIASGRDFQQLTHTVVWIATWRLPDLEAQTGSWEHP